MAGRLLFLFAVLAYSVSCLPVGEHPEIATPFPELTDSSSDAPDTGKIGKVVDQVTGKVKDEAKSIFGFLRHMPIPFMHREENSTVSPSTVAPLVAPPSPEPVALAAPVNFY